MKKMLCLLIATLGFGISLASADENVPSQAPNEQHDFRIMLNSCDSRWFRHGDDCISYTGQCPEQYFPGQGNCSNRHYDDYDNGEDYDDGYGPGYGRVLSDKDKIQVLDNVAEDLQPQGFGRRGRSGCYRVCEYLYRH